MANSTDEFSLDHPENKGHSRSKRLKSISSKDPQFSSRKCFYLSFTLRTLTNDSVERLFYNGWKHPKKPRAKVYAIFKILSPASTLKPYIKYRYALILYGLSTPADLSANSARVGSSPVLRNRTDNPPNEQLLFHGTNRFCSLGEDASKVRLCHLSKCRLCSVIRNSFDLKKCGSQLAFVQ